MNPLTLGTWQVLNLVGGRLARAAVAGLLCVALAGCSFGPGVAKIPPKTLGDGYIGLLALEYQPYLTEQSIDEDGNRSSTKLWLNNEKDCASYLNSLPDTPVKADVLKTGTSCQQAKEMLPHRRLIKACEGKADQQQEACKIEARNRIVGELMLIVQQRYTDYEGNVMAGNAKRNFWFENLSGLSAGVSAAVAPPLTKTVLAALSSGLTQVNTSIGKNFYADLTLVALVLKMQRDRDTVIAEINQRLLGPYASYTVEQGLVDINRLYRAGTLSTAIQNISAEPAAYAAAKANAGPDLWREQVVVMEMIRLVKADKADFADDQTSNAALGETGALGEQLEAYWQRNRNRLHTSVVFIGDLGSKKAKVSTGDPKKTVTLESYLIEKHAEANQRVGFGD